MLDERDDDWSGEIFLGHDSAQEGCHKLKTPLEGESYANLALTSGPNDSNTSQPAVNLLMHR